VTLKNISKGDNYEALRYLGPGQLAVQEISDPAMTEKDVLVKIMACGICGTDVQGYLGLALTRPAL